MQMKTAKDTNLHDFLGSYASDDGLHRTDVAGGLVCERSQ